MLCLTARESDPMTEPVDSHFWNSLPCPCGEVGGVWRAGNVGFWMGSFAGLLWAIKSGSKHRLLAGSCWVAPSRFGREREFIHSHRICRREENGFWGEYVFVFFFASCNINSVIYGRIDRGG